MTGKWVNSDQNGNFLRTNIGILNELKTKAGAERVRLGGGPEGGLALQTPPIWIKRLSKQDADLSLVNQAFLMLHFVAGSVVKVHVFASRSQTGEFKWLEKMCVNKNKKRAHLCVHNVCISLPLPRVVINL